MTTSTEWLSQFRHRTPVEIRYADIDMMRHVNNVTYLTYLEQARICYARDVLGWDGRWDTLNIIVASQQFDYLQPVFLFDRLEIRTRTARIGTKSFTLEYAVVRLQADGTEEVCGKGSTVMVTFDFVHNRSYPMPDHWRATVIAYEPATPA
ncbi:MAG: acyl-CoA thioesterase [Bacteroidetes bacterium]|nr:acyl-CoA thioesterase [Bacteroidota bacterium]